MRISTVPLLMTSSSSAGSPSRKMTSPALKPITGPPGLNQQIKIDVRVAHASFLVLFLATDDYNCMTLGEVM